MKIEDILKKYKKGETSLEEEKRLFESTKELDPEMAAWRKYVYKIQKKAPSNLEASLSASIAKRTRILKISFFAAAASLLILLGFYFSGPRSKQGNQEMSLKEKQEKLAEAYALFEEPKDIIYEDDIIILYTE